jgi:hypothetical protein
MEEIIDIDDYIIKLSQTLSELTYSATFNPKTGAVISVGPSHIFINEENKIPLDKETAEQIIEGNIKVNSCFVDITGGKLEIAEIQSVYKIDDVLHRIIEKKWSDIIKPEIFLSYNKTKKTLTVELTEEFYGTKKVPKKYHPISKRKVIWSGETAMSFLITDYNDPNILYKMVSLTVADLVEKKKVFQDIELPDRFSIYTRRIFKNYVLGDL